MLRENIQNNLNERNALINNQIWLILNKALLIYVMIYTIILSIIRFGSSHVHTRHPSRKINVKRKV